MATSPWDDIPDPCHFEPCPPEPSCGPCSAPSPFSHTPAVPGVPRGRKIVPLVRVNGQIQDVNAGMHVPNAFIEPPHIHWDAANGILNVGGRFVKLTGVGNMVHSDCHGQAIGACTAIMTCPNFSEIIGASTGLDFKNSANPFAGLTVVLRANSLLVLDNGGIGVDAAAVCNSVETCLEAKDWGPVPSMSAICASVKTCLEAEGWGPNFTPEPEDPTSIKTDIPLYSCHNAGNTKVFNTSSNLTLHFYADTKMIVPSTPSGLLNYYSGTDSAAVLIGNSAGTTFTSGNFAAITMIAVAGNICNDSGDPEPPEEPSTDPVTRDGIGYWNCWDYPPGWGAPTSSKTLTFDPVSGIAYFTNPATGYGIRAISALGTDVATFTYVGSNTYQAYVYTLAAFNSIAKLINLNSCSGDGA